MLKKLFLSLAVILLTVAGLALATDITFTNADSQDNYWDNPGNWDTNSVPNVTDRVYIPGDANGAVGPVISSDTNMSTLDIGAGGTQTAKLTVTGGTVVSDAVYIGQSSPAIVDFNNAVWNNSFNYKTWYIGGYNMAGTVNMTGGTIYMEDLFCPMRIGGTIGRLNMTGGTIYVNDDIKLDGIGKVHFNGGTIEQVGSTFGYGSGDAEFLVGYGSQFDITEGKLILNGDARDAIDGCATVLGIPTGYGDPDKIYWDYDITTPGKTTIWAQTTPRNNYVNEVTIFDEDFTDFTDPCNSLFDKSAWTGDWISSTDISAGTEGYSAYTKNNFEGAFILTHGLDTTGASAILIDFWAKEYSMDNTGSGTPDMKLQFRTNTSTSDFATWPLWRSLADLMNVQWTHFTAVLTDSAYMHDNFNFRFFSSPDEADEYGWIDEVKVIVRYPLKPGKSSDPFPSDGAISVPISTQLNFNAGSLAVSRDIYLGTNFDNVNNADDSSPLCLSKDRTDTSFSPTLQYATTYYWRIDENYAGAHPDFGGSGTLKGTVWSFTTASQPITQDDPNLIAWWKLDEQAGSYVMDYSGNGYYGTITKAAFLEDSQKNTVLNFNGDGYVSIPVELFNLINDNITLSFWQNGDIATQPQNDSCFEGYNDQDVRILNAHIPWGNGTIVLDLGNDDSGYDRITKAAEMPNQYEGRWNHWAFTKDTTVGQMKIYFNGQLWHSESGKTRPFKAVAKFKIGSNANGSANFYRGMMDDFRIYNRILTDDQIRALANDSQTLCFEYLPSDLNQDCVVNFRDFAILSSTWLETPERESATAYYSDNVSNYNFIDATWSHNIERGKNRMLVVAVTLEDADQSNLQIDSITYNAVEMNPVPGSEVIVGSGSNYLKIEMFYLLEKDLPKRPDYYTLAVTCHGSVLQRLGGSISRAGIVQQAPVCLSTNSNTGQNSITTNITTLSDNAWVVDTVACDDEGSFTTTTNGMVEWWDVSGNDGDTTMAGSSIETSGSATMSWSYSSGANIIVHSIIECELLN